MHFKHLAKQKITKCATKIKQFRGSFGAARVKSVLTYPQLKNDELRLAGSAVKSFTKSK